MLSINEYADMLFAYLPSPILEIKFLKVAVYSQASLALHLKHLLPIL